MSQATALSTNALRPFVVDKLNQWKLQLYVKGVRCGHCVYKIEKALDQEPGVLGYQIESGGHNLSISVDQIDRFPKIISCLDGLGFEAIPMRQDDFSIREDAEVKRSLKQLAVAGVCSGNIMLFSAAIYLGAPVSFQNFFNMLSFVLAIPVIFYSADPIWRGVLRAFRSKKFNLDLPIGLAVSFGFVLSVYSLLAGLESIYFDSISVVIFIILCSRTLLDQYVKGIYQKNIAQCIPGVYQARVLIQGEEKFISPEEVELESTVKVLRSEACPVDGVLISEKAILDVSVLTGESDPIILKKGDKIFAGSKVCAEDCLVQVKNTSSQTRIGKLVEASLKSIEHGREESFRYISFFTLFVVLVSGLSFVSLYFLFGASVAFQRSFAIIIVACPCAVSFGLPLIRMLSGKLCLKNGLLVKNPQILSQFSDIKNICFDKTGTLTESFVEINVDDFNNFTKRQRSLILSLELSMDHPISNGFKIFEKGSYETFDVVHFKYNPSKGIEGIVDSEFVEILSTEENSEEGSKDKHLSVYIDHKLIGTIRALSSVKKTTKGLVEYLNRHGKKISLLSGDNKKQVNNLWELIPQEAKGSVLSQATPEEKESFVAQLDKSIMVGDGVNDISALQRADIGITMPGALENNLAVSDISLLRGDLSLIEYIYRIAKRVKETEIQLLVFTSCYNLLCIGLSILGFISPVAAAILMPISSIFVLSIVMFKLRRV